MSDFCFITRKPLVLAEIKLLSDTEILFREISDERSVSYLFKKMFG
jgi:hypothetical protein